MSKRYKKMSFEQLCKETDRLIAETRVMVEDAAESVREAEKALEEVDWNMAVCARLCDAKIIVLEGEA